jgi:putative ABC transport system ATP-binding protein
MAILKLTDICKDYVQGKEPVRVLKNVNMTVEQGEYLAIMGPSGSGKTTLMNLIGCLDVPTSGELELDGKALKDLTDDQLAEIRNKHIGFVFQSFHLLPKMDALENVALPLLYAGVPLKERKQRAEEALKAVGLEERIHFLPNQLSGGQCQRVAIARAMVTKPALLLADEPTGALDTKAGNQIMEIFRQLSREGMTIIMITHEQSIADCADKIYYILDGELSTGENRKGVRADEAEIQG